MCGVNTLLPSSGCVVYSFGSNGETSWERALLERAPQCEVHVFDPTLTEDIQQQVDDVKGITFHNLGLGAEEGMRVLKRTDSAGRAVPSKVQTPAQQTIIASTIKITLQAVLRIEYHRV